MDVTHPPATPPTAENVTGRPADAPPAGPTAPDPEHATPDDPLLTAQEAAQLFRVTPRTFMSWCADRKFNCAISQFTPTGRRKLYPLSKLKKLLEQRQGAGRAYPDPDRPRYYKVPEGYVVCRDACRMLGVSINTWKRYERDGLIRCAHRVGAGPKYYAVVDVQRLIDEYGQYRPPYPDPDRPGCYRVPLYSRHIRCKEAIVDAVDLPLVQTARWCWGGDTGGNRIGCVVRSVRDGTPLPLHRLILNVTDPKVRVMHLNDDALDCRRSNLVARTHLEHVRTRRKLATRRGRPCTSPFKGVSWCSRSRRWVAQIRHDGKLQRLGYFRDELEAARAYDAAATAAFGQHARLNLPDASPEAPSQVAAA